MLCRSLFPTGYNLVDHDPDLFLLHCHYYKQIDTLFVLYKRYSNGEKILRKIKNPKVPVFVSSRHRERHQEFIQINETRRYMVSYAKKEEEMIPNLFQAKIVRYQDKFTRQWIEKVIYPNVDHGAVALHPDVFFFDYPIEQIVYLEYTLSRYEQQGSELFENVPIPKLNVCAFDIETHRDENGDWNINTNTFVNPETHKAYIDIVKHPEFNRYDELVNNKAEILASFEKLGTYKADTQENQKNDQINMIKQLMDNTYMVAQTGVINTEVEYNRTETRDQGKVNDISYVIDDIDLGLVERPEAQLKLSKRVANFQLVLANGSTMFDTDKSVNNLYFSKHDGHRTSYKDGRMATPVVNTKNTKATPELVQLNMDDELMVGSSIKVTYELKVDNVGEIDYLDRQFYYTGVTNNPSADNVSKTNANQIIDYLSNMAKYNKEEQVTGINWNTVTVNDVIASKADASKIANDLVNRQYVDEVSTYNTLLTSADLSGDLLPELMKSNSSKKTNLVVSTLVGSVKNADTFTYNNLSEIIKTSNTQGRRLQYSIVGNQEMADQSLSTNAHEDTYSSSDLVTPSEIDADSAQKIVLLPPTGANRNYLPIVISVIAFSLLVMATTVIVGKVKYMDIA